jgi:hypothetical protein
MVRLECQSRQSGNDLGDSVSDLIEEQIIITTLRPVYYNSVTRTVPHGEAKPDISFMKLYIGIRYLTSNIDTIEPSLISLARLPLCALSNPVLGCKYSLVLQGSSVGHPEESVLILISKVSEDFERRRDQRMNSVERLDRENGVLHPRGIHASFPLDQASKSGRLGAMTKEDLFPCRKNGLLGRRAIP